MLTKKEILKLEGLLYLYALSKASSKREVCRNLGISADTLNKYLDFLEQELGTRFFNSGGRGTSLTPEGYQLIKQSENIIRTIRSIGNYENEASAYKGTIRLCMTDAIADYFGPDNIFEFMQRFPDTNLETTITNKLPNMETLEADIFIGYQPHTDPDTVIIAHKQVCCRLFAAKRYLSLYGMPKNMDDMLENHRICDKHEHTVYVPQWKDIISKAKHVVYRTNSIFQFRHYLNEGVGIGICPTIYGNNKLYPITSVDFEFDIDVFLMAHKDTKDMPRIRVMLDYLKELLENKPSY